MQGVREGGTPDAELSPLRYPESQQQEGTSRSGDIDTSRGRYQSSALLKRSHSDIEEEEQQLTASCFYLFILYCYF